MIRIKVVEASKLVLIAAIVVLVVVVALVGYSMFAARDDAPVSTQGSPTYMAQEEVAAVFAAASSLSPAASSISPAAPRQVVFDVPDENEHTDRAVDGFVVEVLPSRAPELKSEAAPDGQREAAPGTASAHRRVLIYHTHTHEAYEQARDDPYVALEAWRTADTRHSIVRVGEELAALLEGFGIEVVHDTTDHEPPKLGTAYTRSLQTLEKYEDTPFDLYIDLHRDAYDASMADARAVSVGGRSAARLMMLIGNGEGFEEKPDTAGNLQFARALSDRLNTLSQGICRPVMVKTGRYNQHISTPSLLIEVGHNRNTLAEALSAMPVLARAIADQLA